MDKVILITEQLLKEKEILLQKIEQLERENSEMKGLLGIPL